MVIRIGEQPGKFADRALGCNKFMGKKGEGHRGYLLAVHPEAKQAIILAATASSNPADGVTWGSFCLVEEREAEQWPHFVNSLSQVPDARGWELPVADIYEWVFGGPFRKKLEAKP